MAMLAAPRRKQKVINLRAKNSEWSNDPNKFGQRMLEKMGWSSGKGLGANENGMVEHVVARYKNDEKGLGFEDKNDQWTKHEDDFNALLANLSNSDTKEVALHSGVSLEVKSKKSKARVHYHKFTRGKDLTRYSDKDLANIFGKKSFKSQENIKEQPIEDIIPTEQVFTEKGSMVDYFKSKLASLKSKSNFVNYNNAAKEDYKAEYSFQGFSGTMNGEEELDQNAEFQGFSFYKTINKDNDENTNNSIYPKSKQKKKKSKIIDEECKDSIKKSEIQPEMIVLEPVKKKKAKKKKQDPEILAEDAIKNRKKERKIEMPIENSIEEDNYVPKKKKKRKNK